LIAQKELLRRLGIDFPIILAPMGGGPGTPELAAAVSNAGGLGSLAGSYWTPEEILNKVGETRRLTERPICVNLFAGGFDRPADVDAAPMLAILGEVHSALGLPPPVLPSLTRDPFPKQFEAVLEARPEVFSFTFGALEPDAISKLHARGMTVLGTATTIEEGRILADTGVDAVIAQGAEAGAHRGTFTVHFEQAMVPTLELVRGIAQFAAVIASGGIMDGRDIASMLSHGASAVQLGTAFLRSPECGAAVAYKQAIAGAARDTTVVTRAFSGRPARGIRNTFIEKLEGREGAILPYPVQNTLTRQMRTAAAKLGEAGFLSLWAGQGVSRSRELPAAELVAQLINECEY